MYNAVVVVVVLGFFLLGEGVVGVIFCFNLYWNQTNRSRPNLLLITRQFFNFPNFLKRIQI